MPGEPGVRKEEMTPDEAVEQVGGALRELAQACEDFHGNMHWDQQSRKAYVRQSDDRPWRAAMDAARAFAEQLHFPAEAEYAQAARLRDGLAALLRVSETLYQRLEDDGRYAWVPRSYEAQWDAARAEARSALGAEVEPRERELLQLYARMRAALGPSVTPSEDEERALRRVAQDSDAPLLVALIERAAQERR